MTYVLPKRLRRPFKRGDIVETCHSDLSKMGTQKVVYAGKKIVRTDDGRRWRASDGWYVGWRAWPFPSIRLAKRGRTICHDRYAYRRDGK
jgi:hypothetical protein